MSDSFAAYADLLDDAEARRRSDYVPPPPRPKSKKTPRLRSAFAARKVQALRRKLRTAEAQLRAAQKADALELARRQAELAMTEQERRERVLERLERSIAYQTHKEARAQARADARRRKAEQPRRMSARDEAIARLIAPAWQREQLQTGMIR